MVTSRRWLSWCAVARTAFPALLPSPIPAYHMKLTLPEERICDPATDLTMMSRLRTTVISQIGHIILGTACSCTTKALLSVNPRLADIDTSVGSDAPSRMLLQASKKHYCVHPVSSTSPNLEEECEKMLGDRSCRFFLGAPQLYNLHNTPSRVCAEVWTMQPDGPFVRICR